MNDAALFEATVPVFRHYLRRIEALLAKLPDEREPLLRRTLAPGAFCAGEHLGTALGFVARTLAPLLRRDVPALEGEGADRRALTRLVRRVRALLDDALPHEFDGASARRVRHTAGEAEIEQDATTFVTVFALPNFFFHLAMAFAILRGAGIDLGKADFDDQHVYPAGATPRIGPVSEAAAARPSGRRAGSAAPQE